MENLKGNTVNKNVINVVNNNITKVKNNKWKFKWLSWFMHIFRFQAFSRFPPFFWPFNSMQSGPTSQPAVSRGVPGVSSTYRGPSASVGSAVLDDDETKKQK